MSSISVKTINYEYNSSSIKISILNACENYLNSDDSKVVLIRDSGNYFEPAGNGMNGTQKKISYFLTLGIFPFFAYLVKWAARTYNQTLLTNITTQDKFIAQQVTQENIKLNNIPDDLFSDVLKQLSDDQIKTAIAREDLAQVQNQLLALTEKYGSNDEQLTRFKHIRDSYIAEQVKEGKMELKNIPDECFFKVLNQLSTEEIKTAIAHENLEKVQENLHQQKCGIKHDNLVRFNTILKDEEASIPTFFGFTHDQIKPLLSAQTLALWESCKSNNQVTEDLQKSVERDIANAKKLPLTADQKIILAKLKADNKVLIIRSSSNEDGNIVNAGGNESFGDVKNSAGFQQTLARVVGSYFSTDSFNNRLGDGGNPFEALPLCSVLVMEEIKGSQGQPITSGVMITTKPSWSSKKTKMTHIAASWGYGSGTSDKTVCDQWVVQSQNNAIYETIRKKPNRVESSSINRTNIKTNEEGLQNKRSLTKNQVKGLYKLGKKAEQEFSDPMDIEFVFCNGQSYIVQARSVQEKKLTGDPTYLDPKASLNPNAQLYGDIIVSSNRVSKLNAQQILFASTLKEAESKFQRQYHKLVIVQQSEASTTHPAVNFGNKGIPCFALNNQNQWDLAKKAATAEQTQCVFCAQRALLVFQQKDEQLSIRQGFFRHPAKITVTFDDQTPIQGISKNEAITHLNNFLKLAPQEISKEDINRFSKNAKSLFISFSQSP
ncbi:MAG: PEP/pyruvate-binding domain-containing protein, partial [Chlamydiota bacterium]